MSREWGEDMIDRCYSKSYLAFCDRSIVGQTLEFAALFREVTSSNPSTNVSPLFVADAPVGSSGSSYGAAGTYYPGDGPPTWEGIAEGYSASGRRLIDAVEVALHGSTNAGFAGADFINATAGAAGLRSYGAVDVYPYERSVRTSFSDLRHGNGEPQRILRKWLRLNQVQTPLGHVDSPERLDLSEGQIHWDRSYWILNERGGYPQRPQPVVESNILQWKYAIGDQTTQIFLYLIPSSYAEGRTWVERDPSKTIRAARKFQDRIRRQALDLSLDQKAFRRRVVLFAAANPRLAQALTRMAESSATAGKRETAGPGKPAQEVGLKALLARLRRALSWARATNNKNASRLENLSDAPPLEGVIDDLRRQEEQIAELRRRIWEDLQRVRDENTAKPRPPRSP